MKNLPCRCIPSEWISAAKIPICSHAYVSVAAYTVPYKLLFISVLFHRAFGFTSDSIRDITFSNDDNTVNTPLRSVDASEKTSDKVIDTSCRDPLTGSLRAAEKSKLMQLLGQWEEPGKAYDPRHVSCLMIPGRNFQADKYSDWCILFSSLFSLRSHPSRQSWGSGRL
jgi:hypothetical protein